MTQHRRRQRGIGMRSVLMLCLCAVLAFFFIRGLLAPGVTPPSPVEGVVRIATYNPGWVIDETSEKRYRALVEVIAELDAHLLAVQEVESKEAFLRILPSGYEVAIADDPREDQELGLAVRAPFKIKSHRLLFTDPKFDYAFPGRRDVLEVELEAPGGDLRVYVVHYKSRSGGRLETDTARIEASRLLLDHFKENKLERFVVLGDFNDTPGDDSVNILETGDHNGGRVDREGGYLINLLQPFYEEDYVTQGYYSVYRKSPRQPIVRGASEDNERLRGIVYDYPADVKVAQALFDQILVSRPLQGAVEDVGIYAGSNALEGSRSIITRSRSGNAYVLKDGDLASDHLPVWADLRLER